VFDKAADAWRAEPSTPKDEAKAEHVYTVHIDGRPSYMIENFLCGIESTASGVIRDIGESFTLPSTEAEMARLAGFVGTTAMRTPGYRLLYRRYMRTVIETVAREVVSGQVKQAPRLVKWFTKYILQHLDQIMPDQEMIEALPSIALYFSEMLLRRKWSLILTDPSGPYFFTSDNPVHGLLGDVTIPLSPRVAAVAFAKDSLEVAPGEDKFVYYVNWVTFMNAQSVIYSHKVDHALPNYLHDFARKHNLKTEIDFLEDAFKSS
jgi:Protein of unknown function (DUF4238)